MRYLIAILASSFLVGALSFSAVKKLGALRKKREIKTLTEKEFVEVMRILAKRIFLQLFSLSQVSARIIPRNGTDDMFESIRGNHPGVRDLLAFSQQCVLDQFHLCSEDLENAQTIYYKKLNPLVDAVVDCIPEMFSQFTMGSFPLLPMEVIEPTIISSNSSQLLAILSEILRSKAESSNPSDIDEEAILVKHNLRDSIAFYNDVSRQVRDSYEFRNALIQILIENQNIVRSTLDN